MHFQTGGGMSGLNLSPFLGLILDEILSISCGESRLLWWISTRGQAEQWERSHLVKMDAFFGGKISECRSDQWSIDHTFWRCQHLEQKIGIFPYCGPIYVYVIFEFLQTTWKGPGKRGWKALWISALVWNEINVKLGLCIPLVSI